ncbi:MAG: hypothetical protein LKE53_09190 [Oscillospiraceae bacterium]|jgi:hypothetical protein|nr:hypothetical protein [Oscillospiraceae bacterium]MDD3260424.1 hypothetical protein [Oscillospiraceae bacterium]
MAQSGKGKLNYRCPSCFMRDLDIDMFYDKEKKEYYCLRCCFTGTEEEVLKLNETARFRYKNISDRITNFD